MEKFNYSPPTIFLDETSYPDPQTTGESREQLSRPLGQIRDYLNGFVEGLEGNSGAEEIGYKHQNLGAVENVKMALDEHYRLIRETQNHLDDSDENFEEHKNNNVIHVTQNDKDQIERNKTDLANHKNDMVMHVSTSERSRWNNTYTKSETDAAISRKVVQIGAGDMAQHIYDTDGDGKVDLAERAEVATYAETTNVVRTASGEFITVETVKESAAALAIHGKTYQQTYTGKNLLDFSNAKGGTSNGITAVVNGDGSFTITGTAESNISNIWFLGSFSDTAETLFVLPSGSYAKHGIELFSGKTMVSVGNVTEDTNITAVRLMGVTNKQTYNETIYPIVRLASITDTTWEPYVGGIPSPNPDFPQEVHGAMASAKRTGKNLLDLSKCEFLSCKYTDGKVVSNLGESEYYAAIRTLELNDLLMANLGKKFTFSADKGISDRIMSVIVTGTKSDGPYYQEVSGASGSNFITMTLSNLFTSISRLDLRWNRSSVPHSDSTSSIIDLQFEFGNATSYEPYSESTMSYITSELFEGDSINAVGKVTRKFKKIVLDGVSDKLKATYHASTNTSGKNRFGIDLTDAVKEYSLREIPYIWCTHLKAEAQEATYLNKDGVTSTAGRIIISIDALSTYTVEQFNAWLKSQYDAGTPVTVVYELATPTEEPLTRDGDLMLTSGVNHVFSTEEYTPSYDLEYSPGGYPTFDWLYRKPLPFFNRYSLTSNEITQIGSGVTATAELSTLDVDATLSDAHVGLRRINYNLEMTIRLPSSASNLTIPKSFDVVFDISHLDNGKFYGFGRKSVTFYIIKDQINFESLRAHAFMDISDSDNKLTVNFSLENAIEGLGKSGGAVLYG